MKIAVVVTLLVCASAVDAQRSPVIQTKTGPVRGHVVSLSPSLQVYEFLGIPFAQPPTGKNRFRKTVPITPWQDTLNAVTLPNSCPQLSMSAIDAGGKKNVSGLAALDAVKIKSLYQSRVFLKRFLSFRQLQIPKTACT